eukprot:jgi/Chrzof1/12783/Cz07g07130.t1
MAEKVLVTGASGYVATELVKQLLEKGFDVRGTVRSLSKKEKIEHLEKLNAALPGSLELVEADLLKEGSFDEAVKGVTYVFHTASPYSLDTSDPDKLIDPALKGTKNVLNAVAKHKDSIKRVVLTSSIAAVKGLAEPDMKAGNKKYSEADWNEASTVEEEPYLYSKTVAEKAAWDVCKQLGIDLVTINPDFVWGPPISANAGDATSMNLLRDWMEGKEGAMWPNRTIDVRDVARAHILAATTPSAQGRYLLSEGKQYPSQYGVDVFKRRFPQFQFPKGEDGKIQETVDNSKVQKELGLPIRPAEETWIDQAVAMIQLELVKPKLAQEQAEAPAGEMCKADGTA